MHTIDQLIDALEAQVTFARKALGDAILAYAQVRFEYELEGASHRVRKAEAALDWALNTYYKAREAQGHPDCIQFPLFIGLEPEAQEPEAEEPEVTWTGTVTFKGTVQKA